MAIYQPLRLGRDLISLRLPKSFAIALAREILLVSRSGEQHTTKQEGTEET